MDKNLIEKVRKLLALSADAEKQGSLEEAALAAQKAQDMLNKYNLSWEEINKEKQTLIDQMEINILKQGWNHRHGKWVYNLYGKIARANLCEIFISTLKNYERVYIVGEEHNREIVQYMAEQLMVRLYKMQDVAFRKYHGPEKKGTFRRGYFLGAVAAIGAKLQQSFETAVESNPGAKAMVLQKDAAVQEYLANMNLRKGRGTKVSGRDGYANGHRDGSKMDIRKGV